MWYGYLPGSDDYRDSISADRVLDRHPCSRTTCLLDITTDTPRQRYANSAFGGACHASPQIAARLYLGNGPVLEEIIADLQAAGLVDCVARRCRLRNEAGLSVKLQHLVKTCENPLARQEILENIRRHNLASYHYQASVYETHR
jgi:hypothetical protein